MGQRSSPRPGELMVSALRATKSLLSYAQEEAKALLGSLESLPVPAELDADSCDAACLLACILGGGTSCAHRWALAGLTTFPTVEQDPEKCAGTRAMLRLLHNIETRS